MSRWATAHFGSWPLALGALKAKGPVFHTRSHVVGAVGPAVSGHSVPPEQMGRILQRTAISTNIKERLDFSCALFGPDGGLVSNAPHIPVHLGAMQETVQFQVRRVPPPAFQPPPLPIPLTQRLSPGPDPAPGGGPPPWRCTAEQPSQRRGQSPARPDCHHTGEGQCPGDSGAGRPQC